MGTEQNQTSSEINLSVGDIHIAPTIGNLDELVAENEKLRNLNRSLKNFIFNMRRERANEVSMADSIFIDLKKGREILVGAEFMQLRHRLSDNFDILTDYVKDWEDEYRITGEQ